ncbi:LppU/SCO3897 family protein [Yinghuangia sp. YIM S09857]|uniref:LppU/SCO3897 family protein n=1 Tax=Yinghuangia sp. YIM S09857 TaxID=3436929 RepID=UPI003F534E24
MSNPFANGPQGQPQQPQPYGQQQPYPGQVPPQQPYPGQQPPPNYYGAPPQQPQGRKPWMKYLRIAVPVVVIVVAIVAYFAGKKDDPQSAGVNDCLTSAKSANDMKKTDCTSANAAFRVVEKFSDTNDTDKCDTEELMNKGSLASYYWSGGGKGVLCLTLTKQTTLEQARKIGISTQDQLDAVREKLVELNVPGVQ